MRKPSFSICPEGASAIGFTAFSALIFAILDWWPAALLFWLLCWFSLHFFRDPERVAPHGDDLAISPADGAIVAIGEYPEPFTSQPRQRISIFMSVFNVHVNRSPIDCVVADIMYFPGKFFNASLDKASIDNERCSWLLKDGAGRNWVMTQIAGLIARRIVCRAAIGDRLTAGERLGMIRFGSRVDLYLPEGYSAAVKIGDKVLGGQTILARKG